MKQLFWVVYFIGLIIFLVLLVFPVFGHGKQHYQPTITPIPYSRECDGGDAYSIIQLCLTETPTATPEATPEFTPTATPEATLAPTDQPQPTTTPETHTETHDERLAPNSLPMPEDSGIYK